MATEVGRCTFRAVRGEVRQVRRWLRTLLGAGCDDALECLSEIFTNAILHTASGAAQGPVSVVVMDVGPLVHIEVTDAGAVTEPHIRKPDDRAQFGRGLLVVNALTCGRWGWENELTGRRVWFEVPMNRAGVLRKRGGERPQRSRRASVPPLREGGGECGHGRTGKGQGPPVAAP